MRNIIEKQDHESSHLVMKLLNGNKDFQIMAEAETEAILQRDRDDEIKLKEGISTSVQAGVIPYLKVKKTETEIDVLGKTPDDVGKEITAQLPSGDSYLVIVTGLSGTGKGTTVAYLLDKIPNSISWSNGDIFRCLTLLLQDICPNQGLINHEHINRAVKAIEVEYSKDRPYEIFIQYKGDRLALKDIKNTLLKDRKVSTNIPHIALHTQGEVIVLADGIVKKLLQRGFTVIMEGRKATLDYFDSPHRFTLTLSEKTLLGKRRAAQKIAARALELLTPEADEKDVVMQAMKMLKKDKQ